MDINDDDLNCGSGESVHNYFVAGGGSYFMCEICEAGKHQSSSSHRDACDWCPEGRYAPSSGATSCQACTSGQYADAPHSETSCRSCPSGWSSNEDFTGCIEPDNDDNDDNDDNGGGGYGGIEPTKTTSSAPAATAVLSVVALGFGAAV